MDKELFRKTEGKLYRYYESKKKNIGIGLLIQCFQDLKKVER